MAQKRCFVISPIGAEGSPIRQHADDVYDYIIKPAMEECGIDALRSDHLREPGKISDQMFREILMDDLCIAVLTFDNPNVYYELAVAQSGGRPVVVLLEKGRSLPFDIHDLRCVHYDLAPRALFEKVHVAALVEHVRSLEKSGWKGSVPWSEGAFVGGVDANEQPSRFLPHSLDYGTANDWLQLLVTANRVFDVMGISLGSWRRTPGFAETIQQKAAAGCKIRFLLLHAENPELRQTINDRFAGETYDGFVSRMRLNQEFFATVAAASENVEFRQILSGSLHGQITRNDARVVYIPYLYSQKSQTSPLWSFEATSTTYGTLTQEFEALWAANAPR